MQKKNPKTDADFIKKKFKHGHFITSNYRPPLRA